MREGWELKRLGDVCTIRPPKKEAKQSLQLSDLVSFVPMSDLGVGEKYFTGSSTRTLNNVSGSYTYFSEGDVVMAKITPCFENGKLGIAKNLENGIGFGSSEYIVYRPGDLLLSEYLYYFLNQQGLREEGAKQMTGSVGHKRIPKTFYEEIQIPVPPLSVQRAIVERLDKAFAVLDAAEANVKRGIALCEELWAGVLNQTVESLDKKYKSCTLVENNKFIDYRGRTPVKTENGIRLITAKNVRMGYIKLEPQEYIAKQDYDSWMTRGTPKVGDTLFTTEAPLANVAILNLYEKVALAQRIITLSFDRTRINGEYQAFALQSTLIQKRILEKATGATVTGIKSKLLKQIEIPVPPLSVQEEISAKSNSVKSCVIKAVEGLQAKIDSIEELRSSCLSIAFNMNKQ